MIHLFQRCPLIMLCETGITTTSQAWSKTRQDGGTKEARTSGGWRRRGKGIQQVVKHKAGKELLRRHTANRGSGLRGKSDWRFGRKDWKKQRGKKVNEKLSDVGLKRLCMISDPSLCAFEIIPVSLPLASFLEAVYKFYFSHLETIWIILGIWKLYEVEIMLLYHPRPQSDTLKIGLFPCLL